MNRTFKETPTFTKKWHNAGLSDDELRALQAILLKDPKVGAVIKGTGGLRKIRVPLSDVGKRGGGRVLYVDVEISATIHLIDLYIKNEKEDLTEAEKRALKVIVGILRKEV